MALENTGVNLVAQNSQAFESAMARAKNSVQNLTGAAGTGTPSIAGLNIASAAVAVTIGNLLARAVEAGASAIADIAKESVLSAARLNEVSTAAEFLAEGAGATKSQVDSLISSVVKMGVEDQAAADGIAEFSKNQLDLSKTTALATVAQNASVLTGQSVSDTYSSLIYGIETANARYLKSAGIMADVTGYQKRLADSLKITVADLSEEQKISATLNAVLAAGVNIQGLYNQVSDTASVRMRNLKTSVSELLDKLGQPFQRVFDTGLKAVSDLVTGATSAFGEGGALYPAITALGNNLDSLLVNFQDLGAYAAQAVGKMSGDVGGNMTTLINNSFTWGANLIDNFASGMIEGAVAVINALTYIGNIISSMLETHSPPKLLPKLDQWGKGAMAEYLKGWGKADFSVFTDIAGTIEAALKASSKGTSDTGLIPRILGDRSAIAQAIEQVRSVGQVTNQILDQLYAKTKITDKSLQEYLKTTLELSVANDKVKVAQDALNNITKKYDDLLKPLQAKLDTSSAAADNLDDQRKMSQLQMVMLDVNATAADKERARLEIEKIKAGMQIRTLEQAKAGETSVAQIALDSAQADQVAAQAKADAAKALVDVHTQDNELLKQQISLLDRLAKAAEAAVKAGGGGGGGGIPAAKIGAGVSYGALTNTKNLRPDPALTNTRFGFPEVASEKTGPFDGIKNSIDALTQSLKKLQTAWKPVTDATKPFLDLIGNNLQSIIMFGTVFGIAALVLGIIVGVAAAAAIAVLSLANPVVLVGALAGFLVISIAGAIAIVATWGEKIASWIMQTVTNISGWATQTKGKFDAWKLETVTKFEAWKEEVKLKIDAWATAVETSFTTWATGVGTTISTWVTTATTSFTGWITTIETDISGWATAVGASFTGWSTSVGLTISTWVTSASTAITGWITTTGDAISAWATAAYDSAVSWAENIVQGLKDGLAAKWDSFKKYFSGLVADMPDWVKKLLGISSPSKVFAEIGANMMAGWAKGLIDNAHLVKNAAQISLGGIVNGVGGAGTVSHMSSSYHYNPVYQLTMQTVQQPRSVQSSFEMMQILGGG
jgi:hypothetical protein